MGSSLESIDFDIEEEELSSFSARQYASLPLCEALILGAMTRLQSRKVPWRSAFSLRFHVARIGNFAIPIASFARSGTSSSTTRDSVDLE